MNAVIALCHFCELHGPSVLFTTQSYHSLDPKHVLDGDEDGPDGVSYYIRERNLLRSVSDDASQHKHKNDTCEACRSLAGQAGYISNDHKAHVSYVSTQYPDHPQVFAMVRQACVRSLSCEVCPGREGPIFFGDDTRGHVISYTFYIRDSQARGFTRWYSIIVAMMDKTYLLNSWPFLVNHLQKVVDWVQGKARLVHDEEQSKCPQRAHRLTSSMTPSNFRQLRGESKPARSLLELTNDRSIFAGLHVRFTWLLKTCGTRLTEKLLEGPPTEDSVVETEDDNLSEDSGGSNAANETCTDHGMTSRHDDVSGNVFEATSQTRGTFDEPSFHNIRHVVKVLGEKKFHILAHHVLIGNQVIIRSNYPSLTSSLIHCLKALLPKGCCRAITFSSVYEDSWRCNFLGVAKTVPIPPHIVSSELYLVVEVRTKPDARLNFETSLDTPIDSTSNSTPITSPHDASITSPHDAPITSSHETLITSPHETLITSPHETPITSPHDTPNTSPHDTPINVPIERISGSERLVEDFDYQLHSEAQLPEKGPVILNKMEKVIGHQDVSDDVMEQSIICLKEEWMNKVKAVFMFTKTGTSRTELENRKMLSLLGVDRDEDKRLIKYWMTGLSSQYRAHMLNASVHQAR